MYYENLTSSRGKHCKKKSGIVISGNWLVEKESRSFVNVNNLTIFLGFHTFK